MNSDLNQKNNVIIAAGIGAIGLGVAAYGFFTKNKNSETSETTNETFEKTNETEGDEVNVQGGQGEQGDQETQKESSNEENNAEDNEKAVVETPFAMSDIWKSFWKTQYENVKQGTTEMNQYMEDDVTVHDPVVQEALDSEQREMENVMEELQGGQGEQGEQGEQGDEIPKIIESDNKILSGEQ